ncbi:tRNA:m(4)X modification enzyme TRM13 homolog [Lepisosteus oculatus]|uniref:tRNA:m(4)X modification enzyme TRM13 homolog n=1 Tax=Lepisosteus oculatus TaxID=7918 RepID=UPI0037217362
MSESCGDGVSAPLPGRCGFFVDKKKRYCKMVVASGKTFCGEHAIAEKEDGRKRIPCPLDPKHTVFEDNLAKHLKKCNSREKPKPVYYVHDINAGVEEDMDMHEKEIALSSRSSEELDSLIMRLRAAVGEINCKHTEKILSHPALLEALNDPKNGDFAVKHLKQQASLLGNLESLRLLGPDRCFVEFGAGKGKLSHWIDIALQAAKNVHFLLVERATTRFKVDGKHKSPHSVFDRLQVDIQHLCLNKVPFLQEKKLPVVGVGKHLCGVATDLALRCLVESCCSSGDLEEAGPPQKRLKSDPSDAESVGGSSESSTPLQVSGLAIALCCHHRCNWRHYVGREFFIGLGLSAQDFRAFQRMSSWATCGLKKLGSDGPLSKEGSSEQDENLEKQHEYAGETTGDKFEGILPAEDRESIGRLCKLLIDEGRVDYLRRKGYAAELQYYTSPDISLENVLLTAVPVKTP